MADSVVLLAATERSEGTPWPCLQYGRRTDAEADGRMCANKAHIATRHRSVVVRQIHQVRRVYIFSITSVGISVCDHGLPSDFVLFWAAPSGGLIRASQGVLGSGVLQSTTLVKAEKYI